MEDGSKQREMSNVFIQQTLTSVFILYSSPAGILHSAWIWERQRGGEAHHYLEGELLHHHFCQGPSL